MKIATIVGARPQFVKAAVISREISKKAHIQEVLIHTGQHFDDNMSRIFFDELEIPFPNYDLHINSLPHGAMTGRMMEGIEKILMVEKPDVVLVYGDTNSTLAGALAACKLKISVAHVEAGLRSYNMVMPEEINRILTDRISNYLFCPTQQALINLKREGFEAFENAHIYQVGDVMYDAALYYTQKLKSGEHNGYILATLHRAENTGDKSKLQSIIAGLNELHQEHCTILMPLHPGTAKAIEDLQIPIRFDIIPPVGYLEMLNMIRSCQLVITDSGGLQKEAFFFKKHCLTLRDETEWTELVASGTNFIVGSDREKIVSTYLQAVGKEFPKSLQLYGSGKAGKQIIAQLEANLH